MENIQTHVENLSRFSDFEKVFLDNKYYLVLKPLIAFLINTTQKYATGKVLDLACGNKPYEKLFAHCESYIGCDIVQSSGNKVDVLCEANSIPLESNSFNTIISTQAIEHIADRKDMIAEIYRLLNSQGNLYFRVPCIGIYTKNPYDFFRFTKHGIRYILEEAGFEVLEIFSNGGKWAMFGQMEIHTFPHLLVKRKWFRKLNIWLFEKLDKRYFDDINTMNYIVVAKKP